MKITSFPMCCGAAVISNLPFDDNTMHYSKGKFVPKASSKSAGKKLLEYVKKKRSVGRPNPHGYITDYGDKRVFFAITNAQHRDAMMEEAGFVRLHQFPSPTTASTLVLWMHSTKKGS